MIADGTVLLLRELLSEEYKARHEWQTGVKLHLLHNATGKTVGRVEVNPETVVGFHRCISEPTAPFWGGRFVPIIGNPFDYERNSFSEAGN